MGLRTVHSDVRKRETENYSVWKCEEREGKKKRERVRGRKSDEQREKMKEENIKCKEEWDES